MTAVFFLFQPEPIIVDVGRPPEATSDISIQFVLGMFAMAGIFLLAAALGGVIVAGVVIFVKRRRARRDGSEGSTDHITLRM